MKITELLNLLDSKNRGNGPHSLELFCDYSGIIKDRQDNTVVRFDHEKQMNQRLNELYKNIKEEDIKFEL